MPVRQTYQYNAPSGNGGGLVLADPVDIKFWDIPNALLRWGVDSDFTNRLRLGDSVARGGTPFPVVPYGGFGLVARVVSGAVTVTADDAVLRCDSSAGNVTLNLPAASTMADQFLDIYKLSASNTVTIDPNAAELINGETTYVFSGNRQPVSIRSNGTGWEIFQGEAVLRTLISTGGAAATSAGAIATIATSASVFFTGRPVLLLATYSMRDVNATAEFMQVVVSIRIDAGADVSIGEWVTNVNEDRKYAGGSLIVTPTQGNHTIDIRFQRVVGAGTATIDGGDFIKVSAVEL